MIGLNYLEKKVFHRTGLSVKKHTFPWWAWPHRESGKSLTRALLACANDAIYRAQ